MSACIAIAGTCGAPCIVGWKYCRKHLQVEQVAAENRELKRRIRLARRALHADHSQDTQPHATMERVLDLRRPLKAGRK